MTSSCSVWRTFRISFSLPILSKFDVYIFVYRHKTAVSRRGRRLWFSIELDLKTLNTRPANATCSQHQTAQDGRTERNVSPTAIEKESEQYFIIPSRAVSTSFQYVNKRHCLLSPLFLFYWTQIVSLNRLRSLSVASDIVFVLIHFSRYRKLWLQKYKVANTQTSAYYLFKCPLNTSRLNKWNFTWLVCLIIHLRMSLVKTNKLTINLSAQIKLIR